MESAETAANDIVVKCLCEDLGGVRVLAKAVLAAAPEGPVELVIWFGRYSPPNPKPPQSQLKVNILLKTQSQKKVNSKSKRSQL